VSSDEHQDEHQDEQQVCCHPYWSDATHVFLIKIQAQKEPLVACFLSLLLVTYFAAYHIHIWALACNVLHVFFRWYVHLHLLK